MGQLATYHARVIYFSKKIVFKISIKKRILVSSQPKKLQKANICT